MVPAVCAGVNHLLLANNFIGDAGATALALVIAQRGGSLQTVRLVGNTVGEGGLDALARAMATNDSVTELELGWGQLETKGTVPVRAALRCDPPHITVVEFAFKELIVPGGGGVLCAVASRGTSTIRNACARNRALRQKRRELCARRQRLAWSQLAASSMGRLMICWDLLEAIGDAVRAPARSALQFHCTHVPRGMPGRQ
jgi:hypothetical protein